MVIHRHRHAQPRHARYTTPHIKRKNTICMVENILVTKALLEANGHIEIEEGDEVHPSQVTAPITQAMIDEDATLAERGLKVGDLLNQSAVKPRKFTASIEGDVAADGSFVATVGGDIDGEMSGTVAGDEVTGTLKGTLQEPETEAEEGVSEDE